MNQMILTGKWIGYYEYGYGFQLPEFGSKVEISVVVEGDSDKFSGTMTENSKQLGTGQISTIQGFIDNGIVSFVNRYSENMKNSDQMHVPESVNYIGQIENDVMYGIWEMPLEIEENGNLFDIAVSGLWLLKRIE